MAKPAPAPWGFEASGKPGSNGDLNYYIVDATGRKIAAIWGKREEKEETAALMIAAPELAEALRKIEGGHFEGAAGMVLAENWRGAYSALQKIARAAIAAAEAR